MPRHPIDGIAGSKPRPPSAEPDGEPTDKEEVARLGREYLEIRNRNQLAKTQSMEMQLAKQRGELVERRLVECQAAYLLIVMRQRLLALPAAVAPQLVGLNDEHQIKERLRREVLKALEEVACLPERITDEDWLDKVAGDGEEPSGVGPPASPIELKRAGGQAQRRREKQTQATRERRAKG
jgi:hypothetical protein